MAPQEAFREKLDVHLITVQVTAETRSGRAMTDLRRDDFRILEDGEPHELALFLPPTRALIRSDEVPGETPEPIESAPSRDEDGQYAVPGLIVDAVSQADQRIVLGFDFLSMTQPHLKRAVAHCTQLLEQSDDTDPVDRAWAVVVLGAEPWMLLPYTTDRALVTQVLDEVVRFGAGSAFQAWGRGSFLARDRELAAQKLLASASPDDGSISANEYEALHDPLAARAGTAGSAEQFAGDLATRLQAAALTSSTASLADLFRSLGEGDGDRALVYFFRGGDEDAVEMPEGSGGVATADRQAVASKVLRAWQNVAEIGASAGFRVFSVDVLGLTFDPGYRGLHSDTGFGFLFDESRGPRLDDLFPEDVALTLATGTGGKLIESNDFAAGIEAAQAAAANTYLLGYQVNRPRDDERHRVKIRVPDRPGIVLRYAPYFLDLPPRQRLLEALHTSANLPKRQGRLPLVFEGKVLRFSDRYRVEVEASLPIWRLGLVQRADDRLEGEVELFLAVYDGAGRLMKLQSTRSPLVAGADARSLVWRRAVELQAEPGTVAVALLDHVEERYAVASARLGS